MFQQQRVPGPQPADGRHRVVTSPVVLLPVVTDRKEPEDPSRLDLGILLSLQPGKHGVPCQLQVRTRRTHLVTYQLPRRVGQWHRKQTRPLGIQQTIVRPGVDRVADIPDQPTPLTDKCLERLDRIRSQLGDVQHQDALEVVETVSVEKIGGSHDGLVSRRLRVGRQGQGRIDSLLVRRITLDHQHAVGRCHLDRQVTDVVGTQTVTRQPHRDTVLARQIKRDFERSLDRLPRLDPLESHLQRQTLPVDTHR